MVRLERRRDEQYPEKRKLSKQNLRDNAVIFRREMKNITEANQDSSNNTENGSSNNTKEINEMKINLLRIEEWERSRGRAIMKRITGAWDLIYKSR